MTPLTPEQARKLAQEAQDALTAGKRVAWDITWQLTAFVLSTTPSEPSATAEPAMSELPPEQNAALMELLAKDPPWMSEREAALVEAAKELLVEKVDYMRRNHLGNPEREHTTKQMRSALSRYPQPSKEGTQ